MKIYISQIYSEAGANYPFSHHFQKFLSKWITDRIGTSEEFATRYGENFNLVFRMSAKTGNEDTEIRGPTVFRREKDVEYTIFIPFRGGACKADTLSFAVITFLHGVISVLGDLNVDTARLLAESDEMAKGVVEDATMLE